MSQHDGLLGSLNHRLGAPQVFKQAAFAAGASYVLAPPGQYAYEILSGFVTVTNLATTANNAPELHWKDADGSIYTWLRCAQTLPASQPEPFCFAHDITTQAGAFQLEIPSLILWPGYSFELTTSSGGVNVQFSNLAIYTHRYPIGPGGLAMAGEGYPELETPWIRQ